MSSRPTVAIVSVNYNQTALTREMLASVEAAGLHTWCDVYVVDNASEEDGSAELAQAFPWLITLRSEENLGFAGGNNLAIRRTEADFVFLLNNDALIDAGVLEQLLSRFRENPTLGVLSPVIFDYPQREEVPTVQYAGTTPVSTWTGRNQTLGLGTSATQLSSGVEPTAYAHGAALLVSRAAMEAVGLMEEGFFLYYEELDYCDRIRRAGFDVAVDLGTAIWHRESVTTGVDSPFKTYWINRSRILFMRRNRPAWSALGFQLFFLFAVLPIHGLRYLLSGRVAHAHALWRAFRQQPHRFSLRTSRDASTRTRTAQPQLSAVKA